MERERYERILTGFAGRRVVVLGDLMVDEYLWGRATRISPESPVMVVEVDRESAVPGGAANVVNNLLALGAAVTVVGVIGEDAAGENLRRMLREEGAEVDGIVVDPSRRTTRKTRVVAHSQQVLRVDREQADAVSDTVAAAIAQRLADEMPRCDAIVISDYAKGVLTPPVAAAAVEAARKAGMPLTANPKPVNARSLAGAQVVSLNEMEARLTSGDARFGGEAGLEEAGANLVRLLDVETLVVTRGARGLSLWRRDGTTHHVPAHTVEVYDVAGAGDTVISTLTLALVAGATLVEAAEIANAAAAQVVRKVGVATVTREEVLAAG